MAAVSSTGGRRAFMAAILPYLQTLTVRLYTVPHVPLTTDSAADFPEPTFDGYAGQGVPQLTPAFINPDDVAETDAPELVWVVGPAGGSDTVYGWWLSDASNRFIMAELFEQGGVVMTEPGARCPVAIKFFSGPLC